MKFVGKNAFENVLLVTKDLARVAFVAAITLLKNLEPVPNCPESHQEMLLKLLLHSRGYIELEVPDWNLKKSKRSA